MSERSMHRIAGFDSIGNRHATYLRLLEQLAQECEDHMKTLKDGDPKAVTWVVQQLEKQLQRIYDAGVLESRREEP